jgi:hypothetical protein
LPSGSADKAARPLIVITMPSGHSWSTTRWDALDLEVGGERLVTVRKQGRASPCGRTQMPPRRGRSTQPQSPATCPCPAQCTSGLGCFAGVSRSLISMCASAELGREAAARRAPKSRPTACLSASADTVRHASSRRRAAAGRGSSHELHAMGAASRSPRCPSRRSIQTQTGGTGSFHPSLFT